MPKPTTGRPANPVGRPPKLYTCESCGAKLGTAAVRTHKCSPGVDSKRIDNARK